MISSELPEIMGMSDRILVMREGRLVAEFESDGTDQEEIAAAMMGADQNVRERSAHIDIVSPV